MSFKRLVVSLLMLTFVVFPIVSFAQDQSGSDALAQRQQMAQELNDQAAQLLEKYNIPFSELANILPFVAKNDQEGLMEKLGNLGLDEQQIGGILQDAAPLIEQGMSTGIIQEYLAAQGKQALEEANIPTEDYAKYIQAMSSPKDFTSALEAAGIDGTELINFVQRAEELRQMGLGADDFDHAARIDALVQAMGESKFAQEDWDNLINAYSTSPEIFNEQLQAAGIDPEAFVAGFQEAYQNVYAEYGFDEASMAEFQDQALLEEIVNADGDPEALAALGAEYGLSEDQVTALVDADGDPEALNAALAEMGYSEEDITSTEDAQSESVGDDQSTDQVSDDQSADQVSTDSSTDQSGDDSNTDQSVEPTAEGNG